MPVEICYTLKSKDKPLVGFRYLREHTAVRGRIIPAWRIEVRDVYRDNKRLWPKGLEYSEDPSALSSSLMQWLEARWASKDRPYTDRLLDAADGDPSDPLLYLRVTRGMSLNDAYWADDAAAPAVWADCNLYAHPLDETAASLAFSGYALPGSALCRPIFSPELTTGGALRKCWANCRDGVYLRKAEDPQFVPKDGRSQISMEFYAAQVAEALGLEHIPYRLRNFRHRDGSEEVVCECPLFTSEDIGYVEAANFFKDKGIQPARQDLSDPALHIKLAEAYGYESYADMMVFDAVILNADRHWGNFGYLVDNNTGQYIGPAPLFDNGFSLLTGAAQVELEDPDTLLGSESCKNGCYLTFDSQLAMFLEERHIPGLKRLTHFEFKQPDGVYGVSGETLKVLNYVVQYRSKKALDILKNRS